MDVELQILKHLARDAHPTVAIVDEYCAEYKDLAKVVSINSAQSLHHFLANSDWSVNKLKQRRLNKLKKQLDGRAITLVIDETGDRKKGKKTDYVARQFYFS